MPDLRIKVGHFTYNSRNTNRKDKCSTLPRDMYGITEKWAHKVHWIIFQQHCRLWTLFFDGYCCGTLTWQWRQLKDTTRRKSVRKERVSAVTELKCDENLNKTNGVGRKVIRFDLRKKCQETAKSLGRDSLIMMLSYAPGRIGAKVRNWAVGWGGHGLDNPGNSLGNHVHFWNG